MKMGEIQKAQEIFEMMLSKGDSAKARGHRSLALLYIYQGKYSTAADHLKESILLNKALKSKLSEFRDGMYLATAYQAKGITDHQ
jgi:tetratricopeptide (TPR) repeat protein